MFWMLKSEDTQTQRVHVSSKGKVRLIVAAALFDDGTGDGEPQYITRLVENRSGIFVGFSRIAPIMGQSLNSSDNVNYQDLANKIKNLSDRDVPMNLKHGFHLATNYFAMIANDINQNEI